MKIVFLTSVIFTAALLSSCSAPMASKTPLNTQQTWAQRKAALSTIQNWTVRGAIAVKTQQQAGSASAYWQQKGNTFAINLFGPLGFGNVKIYGRPGSITLINDKGKTFHATSASVLLAQQTGWNLPLQDLRFWIRGLPAPGTPVSAIRFDQYHHVTQMRQQAWSIQYTHYTAVGYIDLPSKIILSHPYSRIIVVISQWQV